MIKRIFLFLLIIAAVGVIVFTLWQSEQTEVQRSSLLHHIPDDAVLVLEVNDARGLHDELTQGSVLWPDLGQIEWAASVDDIRTDIDSLMAKSQRLHPDSAMGYVLSLHPSGIESHGWLLCTELDPNDNLGALSKSLQGFSVSGTRSYEEQQIYALKKDEQAMHAWLKGNILYVSSSDLIIERAIRMADAHILARADFAKSYLTRGRHSKAHIHCDWDAFSQVLKQHLPGSKDMHTQAAMAGWSTADVLSDANSLYVHGLVQAPDSLQGTLSRYATQGSGDYSNYLPVIPSNVASFSYHHIADRLAWNEQDLTEEALVFSDLLEDGIVSAHLEQSNDPGFHILHLSEPEDMELWLETHGQKAENLMGQALWTDVDMSSAQALFPSQSFEGKNAVSLVDEHIICSSETTVLKEVLLQLRAKENLEQDAYFDELSDDLDTEAALLHYFNIARCTPLIKSNASGRLTEALCSAPERLAKFQAFVIQYEPASSGLFHQHMLLRHNPIDKKETSSLWEIALDTAIVGPIRPMKNHYTQQYDVLVQDARNDLHLIDNTGKTLWTVELGEAITSDVSQVDIYKNDKLQMAFNTATRFIILDRNGNMCDGFPVSLESGASSALAVLDYDKNKKYRFIIGTEDGKLHNFTTEGKAVDGWKYEPTEEAIVGELYHFSIASKDYISAVGAAGNIKFLARDGSVRHDIADRLPDYAYGPYRIQAGKDLNSSVILFTDSMGALNRLTLDGERSMLSSSSANNLRISGEHIEHAGLSSIRYDDKGEAGLRITHELDPSSSYAELFAVYNGLADKASGLYYLMDNAGQLVSGFPLPGSHALPYDLNQDGVQDILLWEGNAISMYRIKE